MLESPSSGPHSTAGALSDPPKRFDPFRLPQLRALRGYNAGLARRDGIAGLTVALFTIPQAMGYAIMAGLPPSTGIITAGVASVLGAVFGSSEYLINGPTNAISVMLAANAVAFAALGNPIDGIIMLTLLIGITQLMAAGLKLGQYSRFVSEPVLTGFTSGAGLYIMLNQLPTALGLEKKAIVQSFMGYHLPDSAFGGLFKTIMSLSQTNLLSASAALATFLMMRSFSQAEIKLKRRLPGAFLSIVIISATAYFFGLGETSMGPHKLKLLRDIQPLTNLVPSLYWPRLSFEATYSLLQPAIAIGVLGAVEALMIGRVLASRMGQKFDANLQLVGEGMCNLGAGLVGGFASSGSFSRTLVNFDAGAATRLSCIFSGIMVLVMVYLFAPAANYIPLTALAGVLIHVGLKLVNVGKLVMMLQVTKADRIVLLTTFLTVLFARHLEAALFLGVGLAVFLALRRAEGFTLMRLESDADGNLLEKPFDLTERAELMALDLHGELFFAAAEDLEHKLKGLFGGGTRYVVLRLQHAYNMDLTCAEALGQAAEDARRNGGALLLSGVRPDTYEILERAGQLRKILPQHIFRNEPLVLGSTLKALHYAKEQLELEKARIASVAEEDSSRPVTP